MNDNDFQVGSVIRGYESVYVKARENTWWAYDLAEDITSNEMQEYFDNRLGGEIEVLYKPNPASVLEELPPGSVILGGDSEVAIKFEEEWSVSGTADWYSSKALMKLMVGRFEVLRRGETD